MTQPPSDKRRVDRRSASRSDPRQARQPVGLSRSARRIPALLIALAVLTETGKVTSQGAESAAGAQTRPAAETGRLSLSTRAAAGEKDGYYMRPRAWGTLMAPEPPGYVRLLSEVGIPALATLDWVDFGLEHRTRLERRDDDFRHDELTGDTPLLLRSRGYVGIRKALDPLRLGIEFQDSRVFHSRFPEKPTEVNEADFVQAFAELYLNQAGGGRPFQLQAGRFTLEYADRRLVNRNQWRNAMNTFDGVRVRVGRPTDDWQVDAFATQVVDVRLRQSDRPDEHRWFSGVVGAWRRWSQVITLEPYYFVLDEDEIRDRRPDREIHTVGLHGYGLVGTSGLDYDFSAAFQFGENGSERHRAFAAYGELGYSLRHPWNPRVSLSTMYATGDREPGDSLSERFDRLFVTARHWSTLSLFTWANVIGPKVRASVRPTKWLSCDGYYGLYWLDAAKDAWPMANRRDERGASGTFVGQELDIRLAFRINPRVDVETGYACLLPGGFVASTGPADDADFFYVQTTVRLFE